MMTAVRYRFRVIMQRCDIKKLQREKKSKIFPVCDFIVNGECVTSGKLSHLLYDV